MGTTNETRPIPAPVRPRRRQKERRLKERSVKALPRVERRAARITV